MTDSEKKNYIEDARERIQSGEVQSDEGSHVAGVFGKAAQTFEKLMRKKLETTLAGCNVDYDEQICPEMKGDPSVDKLSLGKVAHAFSVLEDISSYCLKTQLDGATEPQVFIQLIRDVNGTWVGLKHGDGTVGREKAIEQLKNMGHAIEIVEA
jgi:hypothetical protein